MTIPNLFPFAYYYQFHSTILRNKINQSLPLIELGQSAYPSQ